jgi:peptidoglycan/xylan/chitin deacetylase (PgdA/CDA1 family)
MSVSRRRLLQIAALGAAAGCSATDSTGRPRASPRANQTPADTSDRSVTAEVGSPSASTSTSKLGTAPELVHGERSATFVALTFHGAGDPAIARAVLHELGQSQVRATVLAVGTWLESEPAMAKRVLSGGHELGNHTQHHLPMLGLGANTAHQEIVECARTLRRLTGSPGRWFRASGTQHTTRIIRKAAARAGYAQCLSYDVDSLDWTDPGPAAIVRAVLKAARGGSIVSLHLGHPGTVAALPPLLDALRQRGLKPTSVGELVA